MLTIREIVYLKKLRKRNCLNKFAKQTEPLDRPMTVVERKLRSSIRRKCWMAIFELALAQLGGVIPTKEMKKHGMHDIEQAANTALYELLFEIAGKTEKPKAE